MTSDKPTFWQGDWPDDWWTEIGLPNGWGSDGKIVKCEECGNDPEKREDSPSSSGGLLADADKIAFLEAWYPFEYLSRRKSYKGPTATIDEDGVVIRPWDRILEQPLLARCTACRMHHLEWLKLSIDVDRSKPLPERITKNIGCTTVVAVVATGLTAYFCFISQFRF